MICNQELAAWKRVWREEDEGDEMENYNLLRHMRYLFPAEEADEAQVDQFWSQASEEEGREKEMLIQELVDDLSCSSWLDSTPLASLDSSATTKRGANKQEEIG